MSLTQLPALDLAAMQAEVVANCVAKGFRDTPCPSGVAMALLHSEVAETTDAWRSQGLADATDKDGCDDPQHHDSTWDHECWTARPPKPEGVGSELADVLIRLLDDADQFGIDLPGEVAGYNGRFGITDGTPDAFLLSMNVLHTLIARASMALESLADGFDPENDLHVAGQLFAGIYVFLCQLCEHYGLDLAAEYRRKIDYNKTRPYKHGNKLR